MNSVRLFSSRYLRKNSLLTYRKQTRLQKFPATIKNDSFHDSVGLVLTLGQCFALVPITGVLDKNYLNARFEMYSYRTAFAYLFFALGITEGFLSFRRMNELKFNVGSVQNLLFIAVCMTGSTLLFLLARKWRDLIRFWREHEDSFLRAPYTITGMRMKTKINVVSIVFLTLALLEHALYLLASCLYDYKQFTVCRIRNIGFLNYFFIKERPHIFLVIPFHYALIIPTLWLSLTMTFCWNYVDLMIIVVSIGIATRFNQINYRLQASLKNNVSDTFWFDIRKHYVQVVEILQKVDEQMSFLVMLSCATNLYFICLQLFNSFTQIPYILNTIYFWYSLIFLIVRTLSVLSFAASVHDASRKPIGLLRDIPSKLWTKECQRFLDLVTAECNALSGKKFFYLTKNMILAMAGTVVTYELVLLDEVEQEAERKSICNITRFNFSSHADM